MSNTAQVEPTEEHMQAAFDASDKHGWRAVCKVIDVARLLAEREAKLTAARDALIAAHADDLRQGVAANAELRAMVERLKAQVSALHKDAAVVAVHREAERVQCRTERDTLRARVAELEAKIADAVFSCPGCGRHDFGFFASQIKAACGPCRTRAEAAEAREAQHLADIKALMADAFHRHVACVGGCSVCDLNSGARCSLMQRLAHYDDAK